MNRNSQYEPDDDDDDAEEDDDIGEDLEDLRRAFIVSNPNSNETTAKTNSIEANRGGGGGMPSDSENDDDFEMIRAIKSQLASSTDANLSSDPHMGLSSDSESEDDFEMIRNIKSQLASSTDANLSSDPPVGLSLPSDSENDDDFEMIRAIKSQLASSTDANLNSDHPPMGLSLYSDSESEDDLEMIRNIKSQLAFSTDVCEDDGAIETLRAIRRRFSAYENYDPEGNFMNDSPRKKKQITGNQLSQCQIQRKYMKKTLPLADLTSRGHASYLLCQLRVQGSLKLH